MATGNRRRRVLRRKQKARELRRKCRGWLFHYCFLSERRQYEISPLLWQIYGKKAA